MIQSKRNRLLLLMCFLAYSISYIGKYSYSTNIQNVITEFSLSKAYAGYSYVTDSVLPSGHNYISEVVRQSTCSLVGQRIYICSRCQDTYTAEIPLQEHTYELTDEQVVDGMIKRTYTCTQCKTGYVEEVGQHYEEVSNYVVYLFEQYSPYMVWVFLATAGVWSIVMGVMIIIARKNEEKEKAKRMVVNYVIGLVVIFGILVACPFLVKGIASLVT